MTSSANAARPMNEDILLCTDLDRTLLPNGSAPESPAARPLFTSLVKHTEVKLAYVTGRHRQLVLDAIQEYQLPTPNYVIGDVGSSIYEVEDSQWQVDEQWQAIIAPDWQGLRHDELAQLFSNITELRLQEPEKQNAFKLSYYATIDIPVDDLLQRMHQLLDKRGIRANLIWSIDEQVQIGLLDVLPHSASKLHAIEYLMQSKGYSHKRSVFCGDSGNDLLVLGSHINAVLVANASDEVRKEALQLAQANGNSGSLYLARGDWRNMNGNYSAGILEGLAHYIPDTQLLLHN